MKNSAKIAKINGDLFVLIDGVAVSKPVSRVIVDAQKGQSTKLIVEVALDDFSEVVSTYDTVKTELSIKSKATLCLEILSYLQPEDLEHALNNVSGNLGRGFLDEICLLIQTKFIGGGEEDGNENRPGFDVRDERFWTLAG